MSVTHQLDNQGQMFPFIWASYFLVLIMKPVNSTLLGCWENQKVTVIHLAKCQAHSYNRVAFVLIKPGFFSCPGLALLFSFLQRTAAWRKPYPEQSLTCLSSNHTNFISVSTSFFFFSVFGFNPLPGTSNPPNFALRLPTVFCICFTLAHLYSQ